jgi:ketosteroid isomerase-like protein
MSQENVEVVRAVFDAFNREEWEAGLKHMDSDFEFDGSRAIGPMRGVFKLDQMRAGLDEFFGLWESVRFEIDKFIEADEQIAMAGTNYHTVVGMESRSRCALAMCGRFATGASCMAAFIKSGTRPSKPWGCRSKTLTPTPEPAGYCVGYVAGERGPGTVGVRGVQPA